MKTVTPDATQPLQAAPHLRPAHQNRVYAALFICLVVWASGFPGIKVGLSGYSPFELAAIRFLIASLTLACIAPWFKVRWPRKQDLPLILPLGFICVACYQVMLNYGELRTSSSTAAFISNTAPVFTGLLAGLFLGETVTWRGWVGVGVSLLGVWLIAYAQSGTFVLGTGTLVLMVAALFWSLFSILQKPLLRFYTPFEVTCYAVWVGTLFLSILLPRAWAALEKAPLSATLSALYLGLVPTALAYVLWSYVLAHLPASRASVFTYLIPLLSTVLAFFWVQESPSVVFLMGGLAVLWGVRFGTRQPPRNSRREPTTTFGFRVKRKRNPPS